MTPSNDTLTTASCEDSRIAVSRCSRAGRELFKSNRLSEGGGAPRNWVSPAGERVGPAGKVRYCERCRSQLLPEFTTCSCPCNVENELGSQGVITGKTSWIGTGRSLQRKAD